MTKASAIDIFEQLTGSDSGRWTGVILRMPSAAVETAIRAWLHIVDIHAQIAKQP